MRPSEIHTRIEAVISSAAGNPYEHAPRVYPEDPESDGDGGFKDFETSIDDHLETKGIAILCYLDTGKKAAGRNRKNLIDVETKYTLAVTENRIRRVEAVAESAGIDKGAPTVAEEIMLLLSEEFDVCDTREDLSFQEDCLMWIPNENGLIQWDLNLLIKTQIR